MNRRNAKFARSFGKAIDTINILLCIAIIAIGVMIVMLGGKERIWFPILFTIEAVMNLTLGLKAYRRVEMGKFVVYLLMTAVMTAVAVAAFMIVL